MTTPIANRHPGETCSEHQRRIELGAVLREHWLTGLIPFWRRHAVNENQGGFWPELLRDGARFGDGSHALVPIARLVYAFATAAGVTGDDELLQIARGGMRQLARYFDPVSDAWYSRLSGSGGCLDPTIRPYGAAFAAYSLATFGRIAGDAESIDLADRSFRALWTRGRHPIHGGFWQELEPDWTPRLQECRLDTHLHAMEGCAALFAATGDQEWRRAWLELSLIVTARTLNPNSGCVRERFHPDWSEKAAPGDPNINIGHNLEAAWFLFRSATVLEEPGLEDVGFRLLEYAIQMGAGDRDGATDRENAVNPMAGAFPTYPTTPPLLTPDRTPGHESPERHPQFTWWIQAEGLAALAIGYEIRPSHRLLTRLESLWICIRDRFYDPDFGGWYATIAWDGGPLDDRKGGDWKAVYHETQACLNAASALDGRFRPRQEL